MEIERKFKPAKEKFIIRMSWLVCIVLISAVLDTWLIIERPHYIIDAVLAVLLAYGIAFSVWLHCQEIKFQCSRLVIVDFFDAEHPYAWKQMVNPLLETEKSIFFPCWQVFSFEYDDGQGLMKIRCWLSELSDEDQEYALKLLRQALPDLYEVE